MSMIAIPQIEIQPDTLKVLTELKNQDLSLKEDEKIWIRINNKSIELSVNHNLLYNKENNVNLTKDKFQSTTFKLCYSNQQININLKFPKRHHLFNISRFYNFTSLNECRDKIMIGTDDGTLIKVSNPMSVSVDKLIIKNEAHYLDIFKIESFPSNKVILTIGLDYQIKIWDNLSATSEFSNAVRILKGVHKLRISDCLIIGRGRNIVSCGYDGKIVFWELGSGKPVWIGNRIKNLSDGCTSLSLFKRKDKVEDGVDKEPFFECLWNILLCGHQSGFVSIWDCHTRLSYGEFLSNEEGESIEIIQCVDANCIVVALSNGIIKSFKYDLEKRESKLNWNCKVFDDGDGVDVKEMKIWDGYVFIMVNNSIFKLRLESGELLDVFVGSEDDLNGFTISIKTNGDNELLAFGKRNCLVSYSL